ncbi:hypothetical protein [Pandoraea sp. NPDC087047]|uniref:hypothetical protein n=1 Tax=Pandoraea sp. NPDC087047 TaxID=3364390 RepID=UPI00382E802E
METIDWDQLALSAAERDLSGIVREIAARFALHRPAAAGEAAEPAEPDQAHQANQGAEPGEAAPASMLDWRTLVAIADEAEADIGLQARHEPWVLARLLRLPGDEALRHSGELPSLDAAVDLDWPDAPAPAVFRAIVAAFAGDDLSADVAAPFTAGPSVLSSASRVGGAACPA